MEILSVLEKTIDAWVASFCRRLVLSGAVVSVMELACFSRLFGLVFLVQSLRLVDIDGVIRVGIGVMRLFMSLSSTYSDMSSDSLSLSSREQIWIGIWRYGATHC